MDEPRSATPGRNGPWTRWLGWLVYAIAAHSFVIALVLLFATEWGVRFGGWEELMPRFFARQAGAFHVVVAMAYVHQWVRYRSVTLLIATKCLAVAFLLTAGWFEPVPWLIPLSAVGDLGMAAVVLYVDARRRSEGR